MLRRGGNPLPFCTRVVIYILVHAFEEYYVCESNLPEVDSVHVLVVMSR